MINQIYIVSQGERKYYVSTSIMSSISEKPITNIAYLVRGFSRNPSVGRKDFFVSKEELKKIQDRDAEIDATFFPSLYDFYDMIQIFIVKEIPAEAYLRTDNVPQLRNSKGNVDVFSAVDTQMGNETVEDNTVYSNRAIYQRQEGSLTLEERDQKLLECDNELDRQMHSNDAMGLLKELQQSSEKVIEHEEKKMIEDKNDKTYQRRK